MAGTILSSLSFALSTFSPNIFVHYFFYGLLGGILIFKKKTMTLGIGFGFIYLPAIVCVSQYFESKRALGNF